MFTSPSRVLDCPNRVLLESLFCRVDLDSRRACRAHDPYTLNDWFVRWIAKELFNRQKVGETIVNKLYTPYAQERIHKQERMAREEDLTITAEGNGVFLIIERTNNGEKRFKVDLKKHSCTCFVKLADCIPCKHQLLVADKYEMRQTKEQHLDFRRKNVAPYFWAENYILAYKNVQCLSPDMNHTTDPRLEKGARLVTKPDIAPKPKKNKIRISKKRPDRAVFIKRSRAKWDEKGYVKRTRQNNWSNFPRNPWVQITNPKTFNRKPQGRKPIPREERQEALRQVNEYISTSCAVPDVTTQKSSTRTSSKCESHTSPNHLYLCLSESCQSPVM